jgi:lysophospholipase L1-like esterase
MRHGGATTRSWRRSLLLVGTVVAAVVGLQVSPAAAADPVRVMPLGDSITDGYGTPGGYRIELERLLRSGGHVPDFVGSLRNGPASLVDKDHEGHSGYPIADIASSVEGWLASGRPDVVLLMIGTNDVIWNRDGREGAPARLDALLGRIATAAPQARVIVSTIPPLHGDDRRLQVKAYNDALVSLVKRRAAAGGNVALVDAHAAMSAGHISSDGVHPTIEGQQVIARTFRAGLTTVFPK